MKTLAFLALVAAGVYFMYGFMQRKKAEAKQEEANAAVRYAQSLKRDETRAASAVDTANALVHQQEKDMNAATEGQ